MSSVTKPAHVFGRDREWAGLVRFATSPSPDVRLGIVSGRRRLGKTYLLDALIREVGGFFFAATDEIETEALARFGRALAPHTEGGRYAFANWNEALERLFSVVPEGLIVSDEFPYLSRVCNRRGAMVRRTRPRRFRAPAARSWCAGMTTATNAGR
ncbi:hypothetical protein [Nonomuraea sp. NPDC003201]